MAAEQLAERHTSVLWVHRGRGRRPRPRLDRRGGTRIPSAFCSAVSPSQCQATSAVRQTPRGGCYKHTVSGERTPTRDWPVRSAKRFPTSCTLATGLDPDGGNGHIRVRSALYASVSDADARPHLVAARRTTAAPARSRAYRRRRLVPAKPLLATSAARGDHPVAATNTASQRRTIRVGHRAGSNSLPTSYAAAIAAGLVHPPPQADARARLVPDQSTPQQLSARLGPSPRTASASEAHIDASAARERPSSRGYTYTGESESGRIMASQRQRNIPPYLVHHGCRPRPLRQRR